MRLSQSRSNGAAKARKDRLSRSVLTVAILATALSDIPASGPAQARAAPESCGAEVVASLHEPPGPDDAPVELDCSVTLNATDIIIRRIVFSGAEASDAILDCAGATIDGSRKPAKPGTPTILISSRETEKAWSVPNNVTIRNCIVKGAIRVQGLGTNGQADAVRISSLDPGHTQRAQAAAPKGLVLSGLTIIASGTIPLYFGPGVTRATLTGSVFKGRSGSTAIYLDAESADNTITNTTFAITTRSREQIAIDGSAHNTISGNTFDNPVNGGIFLYRNCGEGGAIRHQKPQYNSITDNTFRYASAEPPKPAVWLNSRNGWRWYCFMDPGRPFGSSLSPLDFAQFNRITGNSFTGTSESIDDLIRNDDDTNVVTGNTE